jgi:malonyl-CoA/methylmalonyl-CoA synthetase
MTQDQNLYTALRASFPADLDSIAVETADAPPGQAFEPLAYTWRDLDRGSAMMANLLQSLELPEGARIAVQTEKSVESLMLYLAVLRSGYVFLPLNNAYQSGEIEYFVGDAQPSVVVCSKRNHSWVSQLAFKAGVQHVFMLDEDRTGNLLERAVLQSDRQQPVPRGADDLAAILYTSGTTGRSKGAMLTHRNLLGNARVLQEAWRWSPGDVLLHALPIFHVHGLFVAVHGALLNGSPMLWFSRFDPDSVAARMADATVFMGVPTMYVRLLGQAALSKEACRRMRLFVSGSAPLLPQTFERWRERTGHEILERYGMSETLMLTSNPYDGERRAGTVGLPLPGVGVRVRLESGAIAKPDEIGAIEVSGPGVFAGYWGMPEKMKEDFTSDGWFRTGDVGRFDADGYLTIVGRSKDLIISGGFNVYPAEVEAVINELPDVAESAVVGAPHPDFGEAVLALVVPRTGASIEPQGVIAALRERIANFKVPKEVIVVDELPRNAMGKVQKNLLREKHGGSFRG